MRTRYALLAILSLAVAAACGDNGIAPDARDNARSARASIATGPTTLDGQIHATIAAVFDTGQAMAVTARWESIVRTLTQGAVSSSGSALAPSAEDKAQAKLLSLVGYIQGKTGNITPPAGETVDHVVARLTLLMSLYVYSGPDATPPSIAPSSDAVVAVVAPSATATTTVQTPTLHAGVQFPPGSLAETRIVVIAQETTPYPANCSGPLRTSLCQYPQFYKFNVFPDTKLQTPAIAAVCHINAGASRAPLADHDRFRIAHDAPANPADRVDGGTIVDGIEILPLVQVFGLTSCEGNSYQVGALPAPPSGTLGNAARWLTDPIVRVASALAGHFAPREAWAIDGIGGGRVSVFSDFGVVDPEGVPDMSVPSVPSLLLVPGPSSDSLEVGGWSVRNDGTATATNVVAQVVVAHDSMLTSGIVAATTLGQAATLVPRDSLTGGGLAVNVPADTLGGPYYVGVRVTQGGEGSLADPTPANNVVSVRVETQHVSLGSWAQRTNMLTARADAASATDGSQIFVVGGIDDTSVLATGEVYDPGRAAWSELPSLPAPRQDPTAGIVGNRLIVAGGTMANAIGEGWDYVASAMSYDLVEGVWTDIAPMLVGRTEPVSGVINGRFYVAGGNTANAITGEAESYDPATNSWSKLASMPTPRYSAGAAVVNGLLYVAGGFFDQSAMPTNAFEVYDPAKNTWTARAPLPTGRAEFCLASIDGIIYALGGYTDGAVIRDVDAYDPRTNQWTPRAPLPVSVYAATCRPVGRTIYFIGGTTDGLAVVPTVYAFTP